VRRDVSPDRVGAVAENVSVFFGLPVRKKPMMCRICRAWRGQSVFAKPRDIPERAA
jgi:hypothetical protein